MEIKTLTPAERQILINQFRIMSVLKPDEAEEYARSIEVLQAGFSYFYEEVLSVFEEMPFDDCVYVTDVLTMHEHLLASYEELVDKSLVDKKDIEFRGFDGNNESQRRSFARLLAKEDRWPSIDAGKNSHSINTKTRYPEMLTRLKQVEAAKEFGELELTADEINFVAGKLKSLPNQG